MVGQLAHFLYEWKSILRKEIASIVENLRCDTLLESELIILEEPIPEISNDLHLTYKGIWQKKTYIYLGQKICLVLKFFQTSL